MEYELEKNDQDIIAAARAYMESREYLRAVHVLRTCESSKGRFLSIYSQFLVSTLTFNVTRLVTLIQCLGQ